MADRAAVTPTRVILSGVVQPAQTTGVAADGHKVKNNGSVVIEYENSNVAALVLTIQTPGSVLGQLAIADLAVSCDQDEVKLIGPFPPGTFNQGDDEIYIDYDVTNYADQKIRVYQIAD